MTPTPDASREVLLLGPGPSPVSARVRAALDRAPRSHLDPEMMACLDAMRAQLVRVFRAGAGARTLAISGTGTAAMEATVANLTAHGRRALVIVTGYFGDRLADMFARYGAAVSRLDVAWGQAVDPAAVERRLRESPFDLVGLVHGETSTGVCNPVADIARLTRAHDALLVVDAVTTLGAVPLEVEAWGVDACYSCGQKGLGAPSGLSPVVFSARALERRVECRSFYFDLALLEAYWLERRYHHTISAPLVFALAEALAEVEDEGLDARWRRHEVVHRTFVEALAERELSLLPAPDDRLRSLNAVMVPPGVVEADVRAALRRDGIEIGAGLGPLAGRIWRVGLMGTGATPGNVTRVTEAIGAAIAASAA